MAETGPTPLVSVIVPHLRGRAILARCLAALVADDYRPVEIVVVDNASDDGSASEVAREHPAVRVLRLEENRGYAGGCNAGIRATSGPYVVLLNDDARVEPGWLAPLVSEAQRRPEVAAFQPKVLRLDDPARFDYAGAAGGLIDVLGYPFMRGRIFFTVERDRGQYDFPAALFWASGTCTLLRRSAVDEVGELDETFFAHMEEIDLNWRLHLAGYRVAYVPGSVVRHDAGTTLPPEHPRKIFLNHRNSIMMLLKNYSPATLAWVLPARLVLELVAIAYFAAHGDGTQVREIARALRAVLGERRYLREARRRAQAVRTVPDRAILGRMYRGSIVAQYFLLGRKTYSPAWGCES